MWWNKKDETEVENRVPKRTGRYWYHAAEWDGNRHLISNEFENSFIEDGMVKVNNIRRYANGANKTVITTLGAL